MEIVFALTITLGCEFFAFNSMSGRKTFGWKILYISLENNKGAKVNLIKFLLFKDNKNSAPNLVLYN